MHTLPLRDSSAMSVEQVEAFLAEATIPLRLACNSSEGYPLVASHWFAYRQGELLCAVHKNSVMAKRIRQSPKIGFEVAADTPPYRGVRGAADVRIESLGGAEVLAGLLQRYLGDKEGGKEGGRGIDSPLGRWLMSRADDELVLRLKPRWMSAWDYSDRMAP